MRIGYHYTTRKQWEESTQYSGLFPARISDHELADFRRAMPLMPEDAVWVWKELLDSEAAFVACILLAERHQSHEMVLLEVEYEDEDAMSVCFKPEADLEVMLHCTFSAGRFTTGNRDIELLHRHVPPERLRVVWEGNLLDPFGGVHVSPLSDAFCHEGRPSLERTGVLA